jgi:hypothetical protein
MSCDRLQHFTNTCGRHCVYRPRCRRAELGFFGGNYRTKPNLLEFIRVSHGIVKKLRLALPKYNTLRIDRQLQYGKQF